MGRVRSRLSLAVAAALLLPAAAPAEAATLEEMSRLLEKLNARLERVEKRNAELEKALKERPAPAPAIEQPVAALEHSNDQVSRALESGRISENEPEIAARLKAVEAQSLAMQKPTRMMQALDGITAGLSLTGVAQAPHELQAGSPVRDSQLNYRGDAYVSLPLGNLGDGIENRVYAALRFGQGRGLNPAPVHAKPNATAFGVQSTGEDDSVVLLGQAWYEATVPLPLRGFRPHSHESLQFNVGKMDPFAFFDQNAVANDETRQFLNTVFVHNALLDAGGDVGVDANGFSPGVRVSYLNEQEKTESWRLSLGVFGAGEGANFRHSFSSPFVIAQAERQLRPFLGMPGNYRAYYWHNGQAAEYTGATARHAGLGISADQRVSDDLSLFGRFGQQLTGKVRFDRQLTLGGELGGSSWQRGGDAVGAAFGWLHTSPDFRRDSAGVDADADGVPDFGYAARADEQVAELYYRYRVSKQFEISPDFQYIANPGGNPDAPAAKLFGVRAQVSY